MPYMQNQGGVRLTSALGHPPVTFEAQPNLGGLGIVGQPNGQMYYQATMVSRSTVKTGVELMPSLDLVCLQVIKLDQMQSRQAAGSV